MNYSWNWAVLFADPYAGWILTGVIMTLLVSLTAWIAALAIGTGVGLLRAGKTRSGSMVASGYISVFRNIPLLLQMFLWFFVVPELLPQAWGTWIKRDLPNPEVVTSIWALALFTGARVAVQVAAGLEAVPGGQRMAALSAGMTSRQMYRLVLLPQAYRIVIPPMTSEFLTIFKNSSVALTIGVYELTAQTQQIESYTYQGFEAFTAATVVYLVIALTVTVLMRLLERRVAAPVFNRGR